MGDLTKNFSKAEFASHHAGVTTQVPAALIPNLQRLANNLQVLRDAVGRPIAINSGYRTPKHNRAVGGALSSQHLDAYAADFTVAGLTPDETYCMVLGLIKRGAMRQGGLGAYVAHTHYDPRGTPSRWEKGVPRPTCQETPPAPPPTPPPIDKEDEMDAKHERQHMVASWFFLAAGYANDGAPLPEWLHNKLKALLALS